MRVVVSGYFGAGNVGDEAVLAAMLALLEPRLTDAEFTILSQNPHQTQRLHGVRSVPRIGPKMLEAVAGADLFLSGGGSLIQDATSARSALYYLGVLALATVLSRRTMVFAQGVGPVRRRWIRALACQVLNRVDLLTVRDEDSRQRLQEFGVRQRADLVADPVFALEPASPEQVRAFGDLNDRPRIGLALREWGDNRYLSPLIEATTALQKDTGAEVVVLAFHPARDLSICRRAAEAVGGRVVADLSPREMMAIVGMLDVVVGVRLHALICAVARGVAPVGLSYDPKVDGLFRRIGVGQLLTLQTLQAGPLRQALASAWASRKDLRPRLLERAASLRKEALRAADLAADLMAPEASRGKR